MSKCPNWPWQSQVTGPGNQWGQVNSRGRSAHSVCSYGKTSATAQSGGPWQAAQGAFDPLTQIFFQDALQMSKHWFIILK
jgi:hypothetical protein